MDATVVVTGATGGLGEQVVRAFAGDGATVVAGGRDRDALDALVAELRDAGGTATAVRADARDEFDLERLMEVAARTASSAAERSTGSGAIDLLVPCAAVSHDESGQNGLTETSYSVFDDTVRTNVRGAFAAVREAAPHLAADGRVLVPTGTTGREGARGGGLGPVAQAAVRSLARTFATDVDQAVGCVDVGTPPALLDGADAEAAADLLRWAADVPADRLDGESLAAADRPA